MFIFVSPLWLTNVSHNSCRLPKMCSRVFKLHHLYISPPSLVFSNPSTNYNNLSPFSSLLFTSTPRCSFMASKTILVTGGAGYIGSHTVLQLLLGGYKTVVVDNLDNSSKVAIHRVKEITSQFGDNLSFHKVFTFFSFLASTSLHLIFFCLLVCKGWVFLDFGSSQFLNFEFWDWVLIQLA